MKTVREMFVSLTTMLINHIWASIIEICVEKWRTQSLKKIEIQMSRHEKRYRSEEMSPETSTSMEMKIRTNFQSRNFSTKGWVQVGNPFRDKIFKVVPEPTVSYVLSVSWNPLLFFDDEIFVKFRFSFDPLIEASRSHVG